MIYNNGTTEELISKANTVGFGINESKTKYMCIVYNKKETTNATLGTDLISRNNNYEEIKKCVTV